MMYLARLAYLLIFLAFLKWSKQGTLENGRGRFLQYSSCNRQKASGRVEVFVTVSSFSIAYRGAKNVTRQLEVNWHGRTPRKGDSVGLFNRDPKSGTFIKPLVRVDPTLHPDGFFRTDVEFPYMYFDLSHLRKHPCLGYWVGYMEKEKVVSSACLQMRPFWMNETMKYLQDQRLSEIMIPGSHDSGCFSPFLGVHTDTLMRYKYAQEEPIFNQLVYGIRYFDFRVGYYGKSRDKFYINHSFFRTDHSVKSILSQVKNFLGAATEEIVILDFHLFPVGFERSDKHSQLIEMIYKELAPLHIPYNAEFSEAPIGYLVQKNKRVLVSYNDKARHLDKRDILWPGLPRAWGNKQHPEDLKLYFETVFSKPVPKSLWASMAELTPNSRFIFSHPRKGLRTLADEINRNVTKWFRDQFWQKANIVATDYFLGNNIIDVAVDTNKLKAFCKRNRSLAFKYTRVSR